MTGCSWPRRAGRRELRPGQAPAATARPHRLAHRAGLVAGAGAHPQPTQPQPQPQPAGPSLRRPGPAPARRPPRPRLPRCRRRRWADASLLCQLGALYESILNYWKHLWQDWPSLHSAPTHPTLAYLMTTSLLIPACPSTRHPSLCPRRTMPMTSGCRAPSTPASEELALGDASLSK